MVILPASESCFIGVQPIVKRGFIQIPNPTVSIEMHWTTSRLATARMPVPARPGGMEVELLLDALIARV